MKQMCQILLMFALIVLSCAQECIDNVTKWGHLSVFGSIETIEFFKAEFSGEISCEESRLVLANSRDGCSKENDWSVYENKSVMVYRGNCSFYAKAKLFQDAGANAIILINLGNDLFNPGAPTGSPKLSIPVVLIRKRAGELLNHSSSKVKFITQSRQQNVDVSCGHCIAFRDSELASKFVKLSISSCSESQFTAVGLVSTFGPPIIVGETWVVHNSMSRGCSLLKNTSKAGAIMIQRGECTFLEKISHVEETGVDFVIFSNIPGQEFEAPMADHSVLNNSSHPMHSATYISSLIIDHDVAQALPMEYMITVERALGDSELRLIKAMQNYRKAKQVLQTALENNAVEADIKDDIRILLT